MAEGVSQTEAVPQHRRARRWRPVVFLLVPLLMAQGAETPDDEDAVEKPPARVAVWVEGSPAWVAKALQKSIGSEVDGYQRVSVLEDLRCVDAGNCTLDELRADGGEVVFFGVLDDGDVEFQIFAGTDERPVVESAFAVDAGTPERLKRDILKAFQPILKKGGVLDEWEFRADENERRIATLATTFRRHPFGWAGVMGTVFFLFAVSTVLATGFLSGRKGHRLRRIRTLPWSLAAVVVSGTLALSFLAQAPEPNAAEVVRQTSWAWFLEILGGMAWGWFALVTVKTLLPAMSGFDRVGHRDVMRLLGAWVVVVGHRVVVLSLLYVPFLLLFWLFQSTLEIAPRVATLTLLPVWLLVIRFWYAAAVDGLALVLDARLVSGKATGANPWHERVRTYFLGYARRVGWDFDPALLSRVLFLPGSRPGIRIYGGGLSQTRIVIDSGLLELAMSSPERNQEQEHVVKWSDWHQGLAVPTQRTSGAAREPVVETRWMDRVRDAVKSLRDWAVPEEGTRRRRKRLAQGDVDGRTLGQAPTLLGRVAPAPPEELVPLVADNMNDMAVVRELLAEHYAFMQPDPDEEYDDTDPNDKDFLFGALVVEIGRMLRDEAPFRTFGHILDHPRLFPAKWFDAVAAFHLSWFSRAGAMLSDAYAALNFSRHHLVQYLFYQATGDDTTLTVRASRSELKTTARAMSRAVGDSPRRNAGEQGATVGNRLIWLSWFSRTQIRENRDNRLRQLGWALTLGAVAGALMAAVFQAVDYHPRWVEAIAEERAALEEAEKPPEGQ